MIYLKRLWNVVAMMIFWCVFLLIVPLSFVVELFVITPILYILTKEYYTVQNDPFPFRLMLWLKSKLMFNTNKK